MKMNFIYFRGQEGTTAVPFPHLVQIFLEKLGPSAKALPPSRSIFSTAIVSFSREKNNNLDKLHMIFLYKRK